MLCLNTLADVAGVISDPGLDDDLRTLIAHRGWQAYADHPSCLSEDTRIVVVHGGDTPDVINTAVGFPITGDDAEEPTYDTLDDHGLWFEIIYRGRCGRDTVVFVENGPGTEMGLHHLCLVHFWTEVGGR
ncbi:hypothetical protein QOZ96_002061 [Brevundimonas nasdae]|uniref:hypothetical protein n=1 Tax=Brevundimonas nasdae TaxID=172043 RepID=UPI0019120181|nr:hypothetical protein [Brevundimonas nasdae]MBK6025481.1 hypothetical protein [Brevundimonas nasdae]MDQ0452111.1 hypothetical protein [Brevundimonas nasdae]